MATIDLTTLTALKLWSNLGSNQDSRLTALITQASRMFMTLTNRTDYVAAQNTIEVRDGTGTDTLVLGHRPVSAFSALQIQGVAIPAGAPASPGYSPVGYYIDTEHGVIRLVGYTFCRGVAMVSAAYSFGFSSIPEDVTQAVNEMVLFLSKLDSSINRKTETLAQQIVSYRDEFPKSVCDTIKYYRRTLRMSPPSYNTSVMSGGGSGTPPVTFIATLGQTTFTLPVAPTGFILWFRNGIIQVLGSDYTISGAIVTVILPASAGDVYMAVYQN
jgi:hypothetical protein